MIKAKKDQSVHVIANGEVVFADWLSGYGLLLIVEHGNGYMSLYGRNQNLYKEVGDKVREGEVIARVGKSGGYKIPELYFAIRHNAKAENPASWCE
jgi:septal ring factor EnvC (AmiA/AmiB activator)